MYVCGEVGEQWMGGVGEDAQRPWRHRLMVVLADGLEHTVVPIVRLEESAHHMPFPLRGIGHPQDRRPLLELTCDTSIKMSGDDDALLLFAQVGVGGIDPYGITVGETFFCLWIQCCLQHQVAAYGLSDARQVSLYLSYLRQSTTPVGNGQCPLAQHFSACSQLPPHLSAAAFLAPLTRTIIGEHHTGAQQFVVGEAHTLHLCHRHHSGAELPPCLSSVALTHKALLVHKGIEHPHICTPLTRIVLQVKELEPRHIRCAQVHLHIRLVEL